ncbi:AAA family ATPase [Pectinatus haikarae]|uniref:Nuclease SbcCD subunit C n=1 Tax=Pectinatus haikarae TaxID=349096 RepID=A0ABT9Y951_9FIRM|nr:SMC family ATPase [Pectinatus haikarae]MDQ0204332.1 exonuclease SbcC [Pectinatus haikarae]
MLPKKLVMSAFGPYAGEVDIDFSKLGKKGIYLISGDTGAGKTTIFDALVYALYGEASGPVRETNMFRSKYASTDTQTYVELIFCYGNRDYRLRRNPEYERPAKRGSKIVVEKPAAELFLPDGEIVSGVKEVTQAVAELIGLDRAQFTQIAMIAQGDFLRLLLSPTKERSDIFRKIFNTGLYRFLQEKLKKEAEETAKKLESIKRDIEHDKKNIQLAENAVLEDSPLLSELISKISEYTNKDRKTAEQISKKIADNEEKLAQNNSQLGYAASMEKIKQEMALCKTEIEKNIPFAQQLEKNYKEAKERYDKEYAAAIEVIAGIKDNMGTYDEYDAVLVQEKEYVSQLAVMAQKEEAECRQLKILSKQIEEGKKQQSLLQEAMLKKEQCRHREGILQKQLEDLQELLVNTADYNALLNRYKKACEAYKAEQGSQKVIHAECDKMEKAYLDEQAGIIASALQDGRPCPVCGSVQHPQPAVLVENAPDKEQLDIIKKKRQMADKKVSELSMRAGDLKGQLSALDGQIIKKAEQLLGCRERGRIKEQAAESQKNADRERTVIRQEMDKLQKEVLLKEKLDRELPLLSGKYDDIGEKAKEYQQKKAVLAANIENIGEKKTEKAKLLTYKDKTEAVKMLENKEMHAVLLEKQMNEAQKKFAEKENFLSSEKAKFTVLRGQLEKSSTLDLEKLKSMRASLTQAKKELTENQQLIHIRMAANEKALKDIIEQKDSYEELTEQYIWQLDLAQTVAGMQSGKSKITLETYIQMQYFDRIIERANTRFMVMSAGQYELIRKTAAQDMRSQSGLELDVIDHYNGSRRSIKTLSGGEAFKASLSLALGLSDEIQSSAGGIQLDTMFVDEGFGSLDEESLEHAVSVLNTLAQGNKLIGIISHVGELKQRIDKQIKVSKMPYGGSRAEVIN